MFYWLTRKGRSMYRNGCDLYGSLLSYARHPAFYQNGHVPDTFDGRFEVLSLHTGLLVGRLCQPQMGAEGTMLAQAVFDAMFKNLDWGMREMGVGDLGVPKRIKKMMKAFKGRAFAYDEASKVFFASGQDGSMIDAVARNIYGEVPDLHGYEKTAAIHAMTHHALAFASYVRALEIGDFKAGKLEFPAIMMKILHEKQQGFGYDNDEQERRSA